MMAMRASGRAGMQEPIDRHRYRLLCVRRLGRKRVTAAEDKRRQRNLLPHLKIFLQKRLPQKGYPLSGAETVFGQVFGRGGMSNFQNPTVPPTGGVASAARKSKLV